MKKTPKILPTFYKSKGTPIFRDTTALPFAKGGPIEDQPVNPTAGPSWVRPQLSPERIAALKELHGDSIFASANPNDLLFYDLNKDLIDNATSFTEFLDPSVKVGPSFTKQAATQDIKTRLSKQGYALDTKTGMYFKVPDEVRDLITKPEPELLEKLEPLRPELISRNIPTQLSLPPQPEVLQYQMPGYMKSYHFPTVGRYIPLAAKAVQKVTGYDRNFMEGYYDEEGNYVPGELENAREQNRVPQFQGASSLKDIFAQRAYQQALENSKSFAQGGTIHFERSEYGSDAREHYDNGGPIYTYSKRPGSYYQRAADGSWMINNSSTGGQYVPINDPTGQRTALLNKNAVVYNPPAQGLPTPTPLRLTNATPQLNQKIYPGNPANFSETTQGVAAKTVPQSAEQRANVEGARKDIAQRKSNLEKVLITQGKTPEQAASIVGSYGSDWPTLEAENARALATMANRAESIQSGVFPDKMSEYTPRAEQSTLGFAKDVLFNPFTAAGYAIRGQEIPDYMGEKIDNGTLGYWSNGQFVEGRNLLDTAVDVATPIGWAHSGYNIGEKALNNKSGDFFTEENAWDALNVLPGISLAAKGMKYVPLANRVKFAPKSTAANLAIDAGNISREPFYAPQRPSLLNPAESPKKVVGMIDEFGDLVEDVPQYFPIGESVSINANKAANAIDLSNQNRAIDLDAWKKAQGQAEVNNWRFVVPRQEEEFLAAKYAQEFSDKYGIALDKLTSSDVALYGKMKEAEFLPTREVIPASEKLVGNTKALHENFVTQHNPQYSLNPQEELAVDAYTRGFDSVINARQPNRAQTFYDQEVSPILEQTILQNKFKSPATLVRGSEDFDIAGRASVLRQGQPVENLKFSQLQEGDIFSPGTFTSTKIAEFNPDLKQMPVSGFTRKANNLDYVINAPEGQSFLYPNASNIQNYSIETEAILPNKLQFKLDKVATDTERGYLTSLQDMQRGQHYGIGDNKFTRVPNRFFPKVQSLDKIKALNFDPGKMQYMQTRVPKSAYQNLIDYHNKTHIPTMPKYYFSIVNPYLFGGRLNKNC